jgi:hypothetical protein
MKKLDHEHGISFMRGGEAIAATFQDPEKFAILFHAGLTAEQPDITLDWVEDHVEASMLADLMPYLVYAASGRKIVADERDEAAPAKNGQPGGLNISTGTPSGLSVGMT